MSAAEHSKVDIAEAAKEDTVSTDRTPWRASPHCHPERPYRVERPVRDGFLSASHDDGWFVYLYRRGGRVAEGGAASLSEAMDRAEAWAHGEGLL